jgi:uncharacterized membrane protein
MNLPDVNDFYDAFPFCTASFPMCGALFSMVPTPVGIDSRLSVSIACLFCLLTVKLINLFADVARQNLRDDSTALVFWLLGGLFFVASIVIFFAALQMQINEKILFGFNTQATYTAFFGALSCMFAWLRQAAKLVSKKHLN